MTEVSYRPRNSGHDYFGRGTYLVTLVVREREPLLASFTTKDGRETIVPTELGRYAQHLWEQTPTKQTKHGNKVFVHACVCMPDHFHGVIEVLEPMQWCLGDIIQAFKAACTSRWQQAHGLSANRPISVDCNDANIPAWLREKAKRFNDESSLINNLSKKQRLDYYALVGRQHRPLFDDNYDDTVCLDDRHREAMIAYVK
ncbi:MAG: hypothetical protein ILP23_02210, partial [Paludibacteraceae bacterium]|nr:hypothetical protein [Paludibacteraceae bacterium]